jgi:predicted DNA-binding protein (MmcQ/YjbR family)
MGGPVGQADDRGEDRPEDTVADPHPSWRPLLDAALAYPEAYLDHPWGENVVKVRGKIFVFFGVPGEKLYVGMKLPQSSDFALMQSWAEPAGYNLARGGWVSCTFDAADEVPIDILLDWMDESYRAVAPKRLVAELPPRG